MSSPRLYDTLIMEHIKNARNYRPIEGADRAMSGRNPLCGDEMSVYLNIEGERIADVAFQCSCCGISMASASMMTEMVRGKPMSHARGLVSEFLAMLDSPAQAAAAARDAERLAILDTIMKFPARARCAALPWATLRGAMDELDDTVVVS